MYPELSYEIVGALFDVYNTLGPGLKESTYYRVIRESFKKRNIVFQEQESIPISYEGVVVGKYIPDFVVDKKVVIELKSGLRFNPLHIKQVLGYLKATKLKLAILAYFSSEGVFFKRLVNI